MSASEASSFEELTLESNDQERTVDLRTGVVSVDYYEDILSPTVTAKIRVINTGDSISPKDPIDPKKTDGAKQSIYNGLPLRGGERLSMKILDQGKANNNGKEKTGLDFSTDPKKYLFVSSITQVLQETQRESFLLNLVSREAITNETTRVMKRYNGPISGTVRKILTDPLIGFNVDESKLDDIVENTRGSYDFVGNLRKPFSTLISLASKSVPDVSKNATAGFVFFQNQDGFKFASIDSLIKEPSKVTYTYTDVNESSITRNNDFNILKYTVDKNQNLIENLRMGTYSFVRLAFNPLTFAFSQTKYNYGAKEGIKNLGKDLELPKISDDTTQTLDQLPTRVVSQIVDVGATVGVSTDTNYSPEEYQGQNIVRYNLLMTQSLSMTVPCNTDLRAGDIITCEFPKISREGKNEIDQETSGKYMSKELCHHFEAKRSFTSMTLVRDTFGLYGGQS